MQRVRTSSWNHQQAWTLQLLNLLGVLSENKGNNVTGGALQALSLSGFTFRNQHLWNYGLIHLASLPSPNSCITHMPFSEGLKKISEREDSNFLRIQKANSYIHLQKRNKVTVESCLIILLTYNFCPVLLLCSPEKRKLSGQCRSQAHASRPTAAPVQTHAPCCTAASRPRVPARGQGCGDTMAPPHCPLPPSVTLAPGYTRQSTMAGISPLGSGRGRPTALPTDSRLREQRSQKYARWVPSVLWSRSASPLNRRLQHVVYLIGFEQD